MSKDLDIDFEKEIIKSLVSEVTEAAKKIKLKKEMDNGSGKEFKVAVYEVRRKRGIVQADTLDAAMNDAMKAYKKGEIKLNKEQRLFAFVAPWEDTDGKTE